MAFTVSTLATFLFIEVSSDNFSFEIIMAFVASTLATLLFIVVSSLPAHVYGDEACENTAINTFYESMVSQMNESEDKSILESIMSSLDSGEPDDELLISKTVLLIQEYDLTKIQSISTYTQTLVDAIVACQSTVVWQSSFDSDEQRVCDIFSTAYEDNGISLPTNFPQTCP